MKLTELIKRETGTWFAGPAIAWQLLFLYIPLLGMFFFSFSNVRVTGSLFTFTLDHYGRIMHLTYGYAIGNSILLASLTVLFCLLVAFPVASFLALRAGRWRTILLVMVILPSWTNFMVQIYSWFSLLEKGSVLSDIFYFLGLTAQPRHLLNTYATTLVGMVYCYVPFMIFPIFAVLEKMDKRLLEASADLGATRLQTFQRVILPSASAGIQTGMLIVFIISFGEFAIPLLLGGSKQAYWGSLLVEKFLIVRDLSTGFALAVLGICMIGLLLFAGLGSRKVIRLFWSYFSTHSPKEVRND